MVEARGLHKSLPSVKIVYCTMEVKQMMQKLRILNRGIFFFLGLNKLFQTRIIN